jgi:hypothetical protein
MTTIESAESVQRVGYEPSANDHQAVDFSKFTSDLSQSELTQLISQRPPFWPFLPIDTLSPTKTVGQARTNLTLIMATIVQLDAATPYASFDMTATPSRQPVVSMHFQPSGYGISNTESYVLDFVITTYEPCTFQLGGYAGSGSVTTGTKSVNGSAVVSIVLTNVEATLPASGYIQQLSGGAWSWYRTAVNRPIPVFQP